jgi:nicotinamidase-related amidase
MITPLPSHFTPQSVSEIWRVPYQELAQNASQWAQQHQMTTAAQDQKPVALLLIDVQNTFCQPDFELFVGGRSGRGAIADNIRLCEFIYRQLGSISQIIATLDTHQAMQIFHPLFWINSAGEHPAPMTIIQLAAVQTGQWQPVQPELAAYALYYVQQLARSGKYPLTIWPYHAMLGGIGHALVPAIEAAIFFHTIARHAQPQIIIKGDNPLTENYSAIAPEVTSDATGRSIGHHHQELLECLLKVDKLFIAGQAQSHCVAWTVADLLTAIQQIDPSLASKVYLLADCTSPVVVPGVVDYTDMANAAFDRFAAAGMNIVKSTEIDLSARPIYQLPGSLR